MEEIISLNLHGWKFWKKNIYISKTEHEHSCLHLSPYVFVGQGLHICPVFDVYPFGQAAKEKEMISNGSNILSNLIPFWT